MSEDLAHGLALIIGTVSSLTNFLENDVLDLCETASVHGHSGTLQAPNLKDASDEVVLLVDGGDGVAVSVEADESLFRDLTALALLLHELNEVVHNSLGALLARSDTGMGGCVVLANDLLEGDASGTTGNLLPCLLDDGEPIVAHVSLLERKTQAGERVSFRKRLKFIKLTWIK